MNFDSSRAQSFRFEGFLLDPHERQLRRGDEPVELNTRYLDALALLVSEAGKLVSKERFLDEVWRGVPVTDEALTQCIRTLRRQLGDDAANPRFIETVHKHGYRFVAPVECVGDAGAHQPAAAGRAYSWRNVALLGAAGTAGGVLAGTLGGLFYGFVAASQPAAAGLGTISVLLVFLALSILVALIGAAGVAFGIAIAALLSGRPWRWSVLGGAAGGLLVGAFVKLLGTDAFTLLFGRSPGDITGAAEGAVLGAAVGLGALLAGRSARRTSLRRSIVAAAAVGAAAGAAIPLLGGRMLGGSLHLLAREFPDSRLRLDQVGPLFGESGFGPVSEAVTGGLEGLLFGSCVVAAMIVALRSLGPEERG